MFHSGSFPGFKIKEMVDDYRYSCLIHTPHKSFHGTESPDPDANRYSTSLPVIDACEKFPVTFFLR